MIYLDYSANTPADPAVLEVFLRTEGACLGNPNASHPAGQAARQALADATDRIAALLGVVPSQVIYTSGASESNNLAIKGVVQASPRTGGRLIATVLEHPSVDGPLAALQRQGYTVDRVGIGRDGQVDLEQLNALLGEDVLLVAVCAVDSELGVIQPIQEIAALVRQWPHCRLHVDAAQAVGKTDFPLEAADTVTISPHKFYGLNGSGLLIKGRDVPLEPQIHAAAGEPRGGTPAAALAASAAKALELALNAQPARTAYVQTLNTRLRAALSQYPQVQLNSPSSAVPHILNLSVSGIKATAFQRALSQQGVCVSVRSACASNGAPSRAVQALTNDPKSAQTSWRISLSHLTTEPELTNFLQIFDQCYQKLQK